MSCFINTSHYTYRKQFEENPNPETARKVAKYLGKIGYHLYQLNIKHWGILDTSEVIKVYEEAIALSKDYQFNPYFDSFNNIKFWKGKVDLLKYHHP